MKAVLLMNDTDLAASLEKFLAEFHGAKNVIHVTDVDSAGLQLSTGKTDWFVVDPDTLATSFGNAIQDLIANDTFKLQRTFVISKDIRWSMFCQTRSNADFLKKPFSLPALNECLLGQSGWIERRRTDRLHLKEIVFGEIILETKEELDIVIHNISTTGCMVHAPARKFGLSVYDTLTIILPNEDPITLACQIVRVQAYQIENIKSAEQFVLLGLRFSAVDADMKMLLADYIQNILT